MPKLLPLTLGIALSTTASLFELCRAMSVTIYYSSSFLDKAEVHTFYETQVCYSLVNCADDASYWADWDELPGHARVAFYADDNCQGLSYYAPVKKEGEIYFNEVGLHKIVSSYMVIISSVYPTRGIVNSCEESTVLRVANDTRAAITSGSTDGSGVDRDAGLEASATAPSAEG